MSIKVNERRAWFKIEETKGLEIQLKVLESEKQPGLKPYFNTNPNSACYHALLCPYFYMFKIHKTKKTIVCLLTSYAFMRISQTVRNVIL